MFGISPWQPDMAAFQASNLWENAAKIVTQVRDKVSKFFNKTHKNSRKARQKAVLQLV